MTVPQTAPIWMKSILASEASKESFFKMLDIEIEQCNNEYDDVKSIEQVLRINGEKKTWITLKKKVNNYVLEEEANAKRQS